MKKKAEGKDANVPKGIKWISILYLCNAVILLLVVFFGIIGYSKPLPFISFLSNQIWIIIHHVGSFLGIAYVLLVAGFIGLFQNFLIFNIVVFIFATLYFSAGIALTQKKIWAKKIAITLSVITLAMSLVLTSILVINVLSTALYDLGLPNIFSGMIGFIIPAVVLYYLRSSKEVKKFFSQDQREKSESVKAKETKKILLSVAVFIVIGAGISLFLARDLIIEDYYMATAVKKGDLSICDKIGNTPNNYNRGRCYSDVTWQKQDVNICEKIANEEWKDTCYRDLSRAKNDPALCEKLRNEENKAYCLGDLGQ